MDIVSLGEILIDMFPVELGKKLVEVSAFYPKPGGACANVAVAAARLGKKAAFIGKVGNDAFGQFLIDTLIENGVETKGICVDEEARTTMAFIAMPDENSAEFIFYRNPGADLRLQENELNFDLINQAKSLHCGSLTLVDDPARTAQFKAVAAAKANGTLISFDVNYRPKLWKDEKAAVEQIWRMIQQCDLLKVNEFELELLTGTSDPEIGGALLFEKGIKLLAVTLGIKGSYYRTAKYKGFIPRFEVKTVDAIGCGDAFVAGLLTSLLDISTNLTDIDQVTLRKIFTYANATGALTAMQRGVIPALPTQMQVNNFLSTHQNTG